MNNDLVLYVTDLCLIHSCFCTLWISLFFFLLFCFRVWSNHGMSRCHCLSICSPCYSLLSFAANMDHNKPVCINKKIVLQNKSGSVYNQIIVLHVQEKSLLKIIITNKQNNNIACYRTDPIVVCLNTMN